MSEQITIPKETIRQIVRQELKADQPLSTPEIIEDAQRSFSLTKAINAEVHGDWTDAGFEREQCQEAKRNYVGQARGLVIPSQALWSRTTMATTGDIAGAIGTDLREDLYIDALRRVLVCSISPQKPNCQRTTMMSRRLGLLRVEQLRKATSILM